MTFKTKFAQVQSTMIAFTKVQIPYVINIISICDYDDWRDGTERT
jgi:hypothetical protein